MYIASGSYDTNIKIWDVRSKESLTLKGHTQKVNSIDVSPDGAYLLSGGEDTMCKLWDVRYPGKILYTYNDHTGPINCVRFNPEDIMFASGSSDRTAKYFRCETGYFHLVSSTDPVATPITALEFTPDGRLLFTAANDSLKLWNMGKSAMLIDTIESPWKGVQDICLNQNVLTGIAWTNAGLSIWGYKYDPASERPNNIQKVEQSQFTLPPIDQKPQTTPAVLQRLEELKELQKNVNIVNNKVNGLDMANLKRIPSNANNNPSSKNIVDSDVMNNKSNKSQKNIPNNSVQGGSSPAEENKKKNFLQQLENRRREEEKRKLQQEQRRLQEEKKKIDEEKRRLADLERKQEEQRRRLQEEKLRKEREKKEREEAEARRLEEEKELHALQIQRFNEQMARQQQLKYKGADQLMQSVLDDRMDASLNISAFMGDQAMRQKFKQYDIINEIVKESSKFTTVMNVRKSRLDPIINWWSNNSIKNALFALQEADVSVVVDALEAILTNNKLKSYVTPEVATSLIRKSAQLMLNKHKKYILKSLSYIQNIVLMYKDELIKLKTLTVGNKVDLTRQERMNRYDRLLEEFLCVFKMERLRKYALEDQNQQGLQEISQSAQTLYKHLEEILRKCMPKNENEAVPC